MIVIARSEMTKQSKGFCRFSRLVTAAWLAMAVSRQGICELPLNEIQQRA
jgi:hypothetical protein